MTRLPIDPVLPDIFEALSQTGLCVLQAPPGAGKTTRVPVDLLERGLCEGRILMLEPRRVATRAAAVRLAESLGTPLGAQVGYRMRGDSKTSDRARIEVVTEGILTRMIQSDPALSGIDCVIFDEFHERSLQADLGLALCLEIREALREDLKLLVMSATLEAAPVASLMGGAPVVTSKGRSFNVETRWLDKPVKLGTARDYARGMCDLITRAVVGTEGGVLVFLPGVGEINRVASGLDLSSECRVLPLHGRLTFAEQQAAIQPLKQGRKVVLATSIAETSLTIEDVRVVVDGGRARRPRFDPGSGMSRLVTERVTKAEAEQRRGRAGRVAEGWCYRLWTRGEEGGLAAFAPPEITVADLAPLMLDLALWGARDAGEVRFLTAPPKGAVEAAMDLLSALGALGPDGQITTHGRKLAQVPAHPRLAHMLLSGGGVRAAQIAAICEASGPGGGTDITDALRSVDGNAPLREVVKRLRKHAGADTGLTPGALLSLAYPDRIALRRPGDDGRFLMSGGKGAFLDPGDPLAGERSLVVADLDGDRREARIRLAARVDLSEITDLHRDRVKTEQTCLWDKRRKRVQAVSRICLGALTLEETPWRNADQTQLTAAMLDGVRDMGLDRLNWTPAARLFQGRVIWLAGRGSDLPDLTSAGLLERLDDWLGPWLGGVTTMQGLQGIDLSGALRGCLSHEQLQMLDRLAPASIPAPTGRKLAIDYSVERPSVAVRLQEVLGTTTHPTIGPDRHPVAVTLLSPAGRPIQVTSDLPNFWKTTYADVRKDMRGRYPKHNWPENPQAAQPTTRTRRQPKTTSDKT